MSTRLLLILFLVILSTAGWARGAYKWVDADGSVHYSDRLKSNSDNAEVIKVQVNEPDGSDTEATGDDSGDGSKTDPSNVQAEKTPAQLASEKKQRKENCEKARDQYTRNQNLGRMYRMVNGERQYLSDKERAEVLKKSKDAVDYWCK